MNHTSFTFKNNILFEKMKEHKVDGILLQDQRNLFWYSGVKNLTGFCLVTIKKNYLLVDQRYFFEIKNKLNNFTIIKYLSIDDLIVLLRKTMVKKIFRGFPNGIKHTVNEISSDLYRIKTQKKLQIV